jgi:hypothetical protein
MRNVWGLLSTSTIVQHHDMICGWGFWKQSECISWAPYVIPYMLQRQERYKLLPSTGYLYLLLSNHNRQKKKKKVSMKSKYCKHHTHEHESKY